MLSVTAEFHQGAPGLPGLANEIHFTDLRRHVRGFALTEDLSGHSVHAAGL